MQVRVEQTDVTAIQADALIINLFAGVTQPEGATGAVDRALGGLISSLILRKDLTGRLNETVTLYTPGLPTPRVVVVGLGEANQFTLERVRQAAGSAMGACRKLGVEHIATIVHGAGIGGLDPGLCAQATTEGSLLAAYAYRQHRAGRPEDRSLPRELVLAQLYGEGIPAISAGSRRGQVLAEAVNYARDLVNAPGNFATPRQLAQSAQALAANSGLDCVVWERPQLEAAGMGAFLGVTQGSCEPPRFIILTHRGKTPGKKLALVGKGITFDSGGINLKTGSNLPLMRNDMAGGAAVLGAMQAIDRLGTDTTVLGIVPCAENLPSGSALKPGDVLRAMNGKTIEIISTDAEGRLLLADAVAYAVTQEVDWVVDVATLTGACGVALGEGLYSGLVANDDALVSAWMQAAQVTGERFWRFPADADYKELNRGHIADLRNVGDGLGGAITGGLFVGEFAGDTPWVHVDIAPTCYSPKDGPYQPRGATGVAVRTLVALATGHHLS